MDIGRLQARILAAMGIPALVMGCDTLSPEGQGDQPKGPGQEIPLDPQVPLNEQIAQGQAYQPPPIEASAPFEVALSTYEVHRITTVTVTGAPPHAQLWVMWSQTPGETCGSANAENCVALDQALPLTSGTADDQGEATFQARVPEGWWVGDGAPLLVQVAAMAPDGRFVSSSIHEGAFTVTPRDCGWAEEINPNMGPEDVPDLSSWLVCAPPAADGTCESAASIDAWEAMELFSEGIGEPMPPQWLVTASCDEGATEDCCWLMLADDTNAGNGGGYGWAGRPFMVEETARVAPTQGVPGWAETLPLSMQGLDEGLRQAIVSGWAEMGAAEHASVASFARFQLELLALGAPASLCEQAARALKDEIAHAQLSYSVASAFAGKAMGPGALSIDGALARSQEAAAVLVAAILEGCIGETLSAAQVQQAAALTRDPALAQALRGVAEDEARHAELSWAFVRWLLQVRPDLRPLAAATFVRFELPPAPETSDAALEPYGLLSARTQHEVSARVLRQVVRPCADALLGRTADA